jgi:adenine-specific DNA-methyltransferase
MSLSDEAGNWARRFGLSSAPLFERETAPAPGSHSVLLDGAHGSIVVSISEEELWRDRAPANWAWSSDIPHHVTVTPAKVAVLRWDRPKKIRVFDRGSIERNLDRFYHFLIEDRLRLNRGVIDHLLGFFRRLRSLGHAAGLPDARATDLFTASLAQLLAPEEPLSPERFGLAEDAQELLTRLDARGFTAAVQEIEQGSGGLSWLPLSFACRPSRRWATLSGGSLRAAAGRDRIRPVRLGRRTRRWAWAGGALAPIGPNFTTLAVGPGVGGARADLPVG